MKIWHYPHVAEHDLLETNLLLASFIRQHYGGSEVANFVGFSRVFHKRVPLEVTMRYIEAIQGDQSPKLLSEIDIRHDEINSDLVRRFLRILSTVGETTKLLAFSPDELGVKDLSGELLRPLLERFEVVVVVSSGSTWIDLLEDRYEVEKSVPVTKLASGADADSGLSFTADFDHLGVCSSGLGPVRGRLVRADVPLIMSIDITKTFGDQENLALGVKVPGKEPEEFTLWTAEDAVIPVKARFSIDLGERDGLIGFYLTGSRKGGGACFVKLGIFELFGPNQSRLASVQRI